MSMNFIITCFLDHCRIRFRGYFKDSNLIFNYLYNQLFELILYEKKRRFMYNRYKCSFLEKMKPKKILFFFLNKYKSTSMNEHNYLNMNLIHDEHLLLSRILKILKCLNRRDAVMQQFDFNVVHVLHIHQELLLIDLYNSQ